MDQFQKDILQGLTRVNKTIPSKYFYDARGSQLFNRITRCPDYYLTGCELEILEKNKFLVSQLAQKEPTNLVELGPGEGEKTTILIDDLYTKKIPFSYVPIDISSYYLSQLGNKLKIKYPRLNYQPIASEFFNGIKLLNLNSHARNLVLFLGSSIGNFVEKEAQDFLINLHRVLNPEDYVLIGFDLQKNLEILMRAYTNKITTQFNLNLLHRINKELSADFNTKKFHHLASYNHQIHSMESRLMSQEKQTVFLKDLATEIHFQKQESMHVEYSCKYTPDQIEALAEKSGFTVLSHFIDTKKFFVDSLWQVRK